MVGFLINYDASREYRKRHSDPCFSEFTYGNINQRANFIRNKISKEDKVFFHATLQKPVYERYLTGCFVIERVMEGCVARKDDDIANNFKNHHFHEMDREPIDVIIFGYHNKSLDIRDNPINFNRHIAEKISFNSENDKIKFMNGTTDLACIGSSTRSFRELTDESTEFLWNLCKKHTKNLEFNN